METLHSEDTLIAELFNAQPDAVFYHKPVWSDDDSNDLKIADFGLSSKKEGSYGLSIHYS